jgi:cytochrome c-type biogenesis protein
VWTVNQATGCKSLKPGSVDGGSALKETHGNIMLDTFTQNLESAIHTAPLIAIAISLAAGVATSFTPCVYPLIPITVGFIGAKGSPTRIRGFYLSLMYVIGLALVYSCLGAFAALTGKFFGHIQSNPWVHFLVANICIVFGLAMLDVITIQFTWDPLHSAFRMERRGGITSLAMGGASALIAAPCTAPVLGILLTFVGTKQNIPLGITMLFAYAFGMGFLLILIGTFTGLLTSLPRSGEWMVRIKKVFGVMMIAIGEYFLIKAGQLMF